MVRADWGMITETCLNTVLSLKHVSQEVDDIEQAGRCRNEEQ